MSNAAKARRKSLRRRLREGQPKQGGAVFSWDGTACGSVLRVLGRPRMTPIETGADRVDYLVSLHPAGTGSTRLSCWVTLGTVPGNWPGASEHATRTAWVRLDGGVTSGKGRLP